jgi:HD domain
MESITQCWNARLTWGVASAADNPRILDVTAAIQNINAELPGMARGVIERHLDLSSEANRDFLDDPDGRNQHQAQWHQWGILTHTRVFLRHYDEVVPRLLQEWGLSERIRTLLASPVDGVARWDLLRVAILLHDIGKFAARTYSQSGFHFARHERLSGEIIRRELDLARFGLTPAQIGYVARTAEDHFVLAVVRKQAREIRTYDERFVGSQEFSDMSRRVMSEHPDDYVEIAVLFLGDSLAKADPQTGPERAVSQHIVNVAAARRYLEIVLGVAQAC